MAFIQSMQVSTDDRDALLAVARYAWVFCTALSASAAAGS